MSRVQITTSADGQSEVQKMELAVHPRDEEEEKEEETGETVWVGAGTQ